MSEQKAAIERNGEATLLVVDDEPEIVALLDEYFTGLGYRVLTAEDGATALKRAEQSPDLIVLDEPTSALDYGNTVRVLSTVRQLAREGMSIVQSTHQPDQAFLYADQTLVINDGRVHAFGSPKDVITKELVSTIYDVDVEVNSLYGDKVRVCVPVREIER